MTPARAPSDRDPAASTATGTIAAALLLCTAVALAPLEPPALAAGGAVAVGVVFGARALRRSLSALLPATVAIAATTFPIALTHGASQAAFVALRALGTILIAVSLFGTVRPEELGPALRGVGVPGAIAWACSSALRYGAVLREEGRRLLLARRLRGRTRYSDGAALVGALLGRAADRADRVELAMALRGFDPAAASARGRLSRADLRPLGVVLLAAVFIHVAARARF